MRPFVNKNANKQFFSKSTRMTLPQSEGQAKQVKQKSACASRVLFDHCLVTKILALSLNYERRTESDLSAGHSLPHYNE